MISLCVPTRGRPEQFAAMVRQAQARANRRIDVVARIDTDDVAYPELDGVRYVRAERALANGHTSMSHLWTECWAHAEGSIAMLCGDDAVFMSRGWDAEVERAFERVNDRIMLVYANDLSRAPRPIMPFVSREWIDAVGYFTPEGWPGWYADTWLWHLASDVQRSVYLPRVHIRHDYRGGTDQTYRDGEASRAAAGGNGALRQRFYGAEETRKRARDAAALRDAMTDRTHFMPNPLPPWARSARTSGAAAQFDAEHRGDTVVAVHCYAGDADQVARGLYVHQRHGCRVVVVSPEDAPVNLAGVDCIQAGKRGYTGRVTLDRQREQLRLLLDTYRENWFLLNDADSFCLQPQLPEYLYRSTNLFWSNEVPERRPHRSVYPKIAFHPPYFAHRATLERLLTVDVPADPRTPFIDWYMVALACESRTPHRTFPNGKSMVAWRHGPLPRTEEQDDDYRHEQLTSGGRDGAAQMILHVRRGANMVHAIKHADVLERVVREADNRRRRVL